MQERRSGPMGAGKLGRCKLGLGKLGLGKLGWGKLGRSYVAILKYCIILILHGNRLRRPNVLVMLSFSFTAKRCNFQRTTKATKRESHSII